MSAFVNSSTQNAVLNWKVFVTPSVPTVSADFAPGETVRMWSPISSILIYGERDAVLVDTPTTTAQATVLADWVLASGKNLTTIYTTHGHGDHFFGGLCAGLFVALKCPVFNSLHRRTVGVLNLNHSSGLKSSATSTRIPICSASRFTLTPHLVSSFLWR
jgi:Metallo-beta-lactamase superfamily